MFLFFFQTPFHDPLLQKLYENIISGYSVWIGRATLIIRFRIRMFFFLTVYRASKKFLMLRDPV